MFLYFFYQKIGWTPCDKNMIATPWKIFQKEISPNFEVKKKTKSYKVSALQVNASLSSIKKCNGLGQKAPPPVGYRVKVCPSCVPIMDHKLSVNMI